MAHYKRFDEEMKREVTGEALTPVMRFPSRMRGLSICTYLMIILIILVISAFISDRAFLVALISSILLAVILYGITTNVTRDMLTVCERGLLYGLDGWSVIFYPFSDIEIICKWDSSHLWMGKEEGVLVIFDKKAIRKKQGWRIIEKRFKDSYKTSLSQMRKYFGERWNEVYRPEIVLRTVDELFTFLAEYDKGKTPWLNWGKPDK